MTQGETMYRIVKGPSGELSYLKVLENGGIAFTESPGNKDWEEYQKWIEEGNTPEVVEHLTEIPTE